MLHRKVAIPAIGRFEIVQEPARLEFSEKLIHPPQYQVVFSQSDEVDHGLVDYLSHRQHLDRKAAEDKLRETGNKLKEYIARNALEWSGVGELSARRGEISFKPVLSYPLPKPVHAEKVFRENVAHTVLIGDREFQKTTEVIENTKGRRSPGFMIVAIALLGLAILFILWNLYADNWHFNPGSRWNGLGYVETLRR